MSDKLIKVDIVFKNSETIEKPSILAILNKKGVNIPSQCLDGFCGTCKCDKPKEGYIKNKDGYNESNIIASYDKENEILPCVSKIDREKIKFDDSGKGVLTFMFPQRLLSQELLDDIKQKEYQKNSIEITSFVNTKKETKSKNKVKLT